MRRVAVQRKPGKLTPDYLLFGVTIALLCLGIVMVYSASSARAYAQLGDAAFYLKRQVLWIIVGLVALYITMHIDFHYWQRLAWPAMVFSLVSLVTVVLVGDVISGSKRWIDLGFFNFQPTELTKLALVLFLSTFFSRLSKEKLSSFTKGFVPPLLWIGITDLLIMLQPDFGSVVAISGVAFILLFTAGIPWGYLGLLAGATIPALWGLAWAEPYRVRRLMAFLNPWADPSDTGYQTIQSLLALGSGGFFGLGLGQSRQKFSYLPANHTDFIFAILGEELGLLGTITVLALFMVFAFRGFRIALKAPDFFGSLLATGLTSMIVFQAAMNIGVISGALPITGITLPLISYGGSSLAITLASIGILLNISAHSAR
ncbi:MAG: putative lipid II flippase FtsW [Firmicutes bacterium]|nr:putative lipid II flippase FtsW [Bacillota bacterium]